MNFPISSSALALSFSLSLSLALSAQAGVTLVQSYRQLDGKSPAVANTIRLDKDRVRIDAGADGDQYFLYRGDKKVFVTVNLKEKSYMEITEKEFLEAAAKMEDAMSKMKANLEKMPPEQRKMMEEMMAKMMPGAGGGPKTAYKKAGSGGKINVWDTDRYIGTREGAKQSEVWTTSPKFMGLAEADFQVLKDMAKYFERFSKNMEGMLGDKSNGLDGIPVKTVSYKDGKPAFESEIKEVKKETLAASLFEVPAGLTQRKMGAPR